MPPRVHPDQLNLLDWKPIDPVKAFEPDVVRAASIRAMLAKAVSAALKDCGKTRDEVADAISDYLGERLSKEMLDAYASEAKEEHVISLPRFLALIHATGDRRLLQALAEGFGWAVIDNKLLPAIEDAQLAAKVDELKARQRMARRRWEGSAS